jgi:hypothetical protein
MQIFKTTLELLHLALLVWDSLPNVKAVRARVHKREEYARMLFASLSAFPEYKLSIALAEVEAVAHR